MGEYPKEGEHVKTEYGPATISHIRKKEVYVILESGPLQGQKIPLPISSISTLITPEDVSKKVIRFDKPQKIPMRTKDLMNTKIHKQKCIDSLRFGLVPNEYIEQLTFGFEDLEKWMLSTFPDSNQSRNQVVHQIVGRFGEGKSHTMSVIRHLAMREGYLVARVEVDGNRVSLSNPQSFLYSLLNALSGKNLKPVMPLLNLYLKAIYKGSSAPTVVPHGVNKNDRIEIMYNLIQRLESYGYIEHLDYLLDLVLTCSDEMTATEVKADIVEATKDRIHPWSIRLYPMIGKTVVDRPRDFVECIVGTAIVATLAGYKGLIVTIDEFEVESALLAPKDKIRAKDTLNLLSKYLVGSTEYPNSSLGIYFATVPEEVSELKELIDILVDGSDGKTYTIQAFEEWNSNSSEQVSVAKRIHEIYKESYSCNHYSDLDIVSRLDSEIDKMDLYDSGGIRSFMKQYIGLLDSLYGPPFGTDI
ncbi:P-loop protein of unknown function [Methanococcoides vulcani]|uniref:Uncharacterized protein n=1 Tax=Methanococcoides vulcani TaxID=1353158 RepID=A0A1I0B746_9EURY|nr:BREX system ATP-binding domain-containing protein [Methanococcoides vulcani]SET02522.1 P-loop protein of unknown function [Methanococcoides vulcani]